MAEARIVLTTVATDTDAEKIARDLVESRVAACVNIVPGLRSIYRWNGEISDEREILLLVKTTSGRVDDVRERIEALHPYELPEFVVLAPESVGADYGEWLAENTYEG
jgi:periplasmic divalent cation tolerance protein